MPCGVKQQLDRGHSRGSVVVSKREKWEVFAAWSTRIVRNEVMFKVQEEGSPVAPLLKSVCISVKF